MESYVPTFTHTLFRSSTLGRLGSLCVEQPLSATYQAPLPQVLTNIIMAYLGTSNALLFTLQMDDQYTIAPRKTLDSALDSCLFDAGKWYEYIGRVGFGVEPANIQYIYNLLTQDCTRYSSWWNKKKVCETCHLILIPSVVNGQPIALDSFRQLAGQNGRLYTHNGPITEESSLPVCWLLMPRRTITNTIKTGLPHAAIANLLLRHNASVGARDQDGTTPLMNAASNGHLNIATLLLKHRGDLEAKDNNGWTPLMNTAANGHSNLTTLLLRHKKNIGVKNNDGWWRWQLKK